MALLKKPPRRVLVKKPAIKTPKASNPSGGKPKAKVKEGGAFERAAAEQKRWEAESGKPFDVSVPVGGNLDVYLLDHGEPWYRYEHTIGASATSRGKTYPCLQDSGEMCPLCAKEGKTGTYVMYLTAVVPKETYTKQGDTRPTTRRFQKKLFPIKVKMADKYRRLYVKEGTFRGLKLRLFRAGKMDAKTGNDFEVLGTLSEAKIKAYASGEIKGLNDNETKDRIKKANLAEPFDYDKIMPTVDAKTLSLMVGSAPSAGDSLGDADFGGDDDDDGWGADDD